MTNSDYIQIAGNIVDVGVLIVYLFTLFAIKRQASIAETTAKSAEATANQALNAAFLQLFPIIEKHHSSAVAEYRRFARHELPQKCAAARQAKQKLKEADPCAAKMASDVANYYESLGMLIEHGDGKLISDIERMLLDMVQASAHDIWEIFHENLDVIHDNPEMIGTWAGSFERLYFRIAKFNNALQATKPELKRV